MQPTENEAPCVSVITGHLLPSGVTASPSGLAISALCATTTAEMEDRTSVHMALALTLTVLSLDRYSFGFWHIKRPAVPVYMHYFCWLLFLFQPKFQCICDSGWQSSAGNPACVTDVNECELPNKPCSTNPVVPCYNTEGSFYCGACPAGNHI